MQLPGEGLGVAETVSWAGHCLRNDVFGDRHVRVGFSEKVYDPELGPRLSPLHVIADNATYNAHNYPLSIAGWALAEARIICWPGERDVACNFDRVDRLDKLSELDRLVMDERLINAPPYLARTIDTKQLQEAFASRSLRLGDFYQDWESWSPARRYSQFISVPVPLLVDESELSSVPEYGVFNVDCSDELPLLNAVTEPVLKVVCDVIAAAYSGETGSQ